MPTPSLRSAPILLLLAAFGCAEAKSPSGAPRVFVEATVVEGDAATLAELPSGAIAERAANAHVRRVSSTHVLVEDGVAARVSGLDPSVVTLDVRPVVEGERVRLGVTFTSPAGGDPRREAIVVADHEPAVLAKLGAPERLVVVEATIVRSDADLRAIMERKASARPAPARP